ARDLVVERRRAVVGGGIVRGRIVRGRVVRRRCIVGGCRIVRGRSVICRSRVVGRWPIAICRRRVIDAGRVVGGSWCAVVPIPVPVAITIARALVTITPIAGKGLLAAEEKRGEDEHRTGRD